MKNFIVIHNPPGQLFSFGDMIPVDITPTLFKDAIRQAIDLRKTNTSDIIQVINTKTGKVLDVTLHSNNVVLITHALSNGC